MDPADPLITVRPGGQGRTIRTTADLETWARTQVSADLAEPFTYVIITDGLPRLAPRRSEHVAL